MNEFEPGDNPIADILWAEEQEPEWLVKDLMLQGSLICLAGEPGAGKSYVSYSAALALGSGVQALGGIIPATDPKKVLYFDQENGVGDRDKYLRRSWTGLTRDGNAPDVGLLHEHFRPVHFALGGPDWFERAAEWVEHWHPHLMVFDTATPCFHIQDENNNAEATQVINDLRRLMRLTDPVATTIVLKHAKVSSEKGGKRTMRGAKAWQGAADAVWFQVRSPGRPRRHNLQLTRLIPDKTRAYGLDATIYITPHYTDEEKTGLVLEASYTPSKEHKSALTRGGEEDSE